MKERGYSIKEICEFLQKERPDKQEKLRYSREGFRCPGAGNRGMGGLSRTAVFIPESIHFLVAPQACMFHCITDLWMNGYTEGIYQIRLSDKELILGEVADILEREIFAQLPTLKPCPKVIMITVTCADGLIQTDYSRIKKRLKVEYGIRFGVIEMFPILEESIVKHTDKFVESVYGMIDADQSKPKRNMVNILGKVEPARTDTDFYKVLEEAGYTVNEIRQCRTLEEFDRMGEAKLNIVLSEFSLYAAKMMERKYGVPFMYWNQHMSPESIQSNYARLEEILELHLDVSKYEQKAKEKADQVRRLAEGKTFAVGQSLDYNPAKVACDLVALGLSVKYFFVDKIRKEDLSYYQWLMENSEEIRVYLAPDISMMRFMDNPQEVDYTLGGANMMLKHVPGISFIRLGEEPYDFETFIEIMEQMEEQLSADAAEKRNVKAAEPDIGQNLFARNWAVYPKEEEKDGALI
ncbi:nitrogenase component 1 [Roseburia hominis]